jgi:hypothetical protein
MKTNKKPVQLTPKMLRNLIEVEVKKGFGKMKDPEEHDAKEVDADEYGDDANIEHPVDWQKTATGEKAMGESFDKHVDYIKALKLHEARLLKNLKRVQEAKKRAVAYLAKAY